MLAIEKKKISNKIYNELMIILLNVSSKYITIYIYILKIAF